MGRIKFSGGIGVQGGQLVVDKDTSPAEVSISPLSITHDEGDTGATNYTYTLSRVANPLMSNTGLKGTVTYVVTGSGSEPALATDFIGDALPTGTVTFAIGDEEKDLIIQVKGDTNPEPDREFTVTIYAGDNTTIDGSAYAATGTITDDDAEVFNITLSSNTNNYDLRSAVDGMAYSGGSVPAIVTLTIDNGVTIGSTSTSTVALDTGTFPSGSELYIINNGRIQGRGGNGGNGGGGGSGGGGGAGGPALQLQYATDITNNGEIWAGGGGGGGGRATYYSCPIYESYATGYVGGSAGSGGAGTNAGSGGSRGNGTGSYDGLNGSSGSATSGGGTRAGKTYSTPCGSKTGGTGGAGGGPGLNGNNGSGGGTGSNGSGGSAGDYIVGNSFATWTATGDRLGGVS